MIKSSQRQPGCRKWSLIGSMNALLGGHSYLGREVTLHMEWLIMRCTSHHGAPNLPASSGCQESLTILENHPKSSCVRSYKGVPPIPPFICYQDEWNSIVYPRIPRMNKHITWNHRFSSALSAALGAQNAIIVLQSLVGWIYFWWRRSFNSYSNSLYQACSADYICIYIFVVQSSFMHPKFLKKILPSTALKSKFKLFFPSVNSETGGAFQSTNWKAKLSEKISLHTPTCNDYPWSLVWPGGPQTTLPIARKPQKYRWSLPKTSIVVEVRLSCTCEEKKIEPWQLYVYTVYTVYYTPFNLRMSRSIRRDPGRCL